jgi:4-amino-4-deoxy-L-arabinose transferase-like glycosyltransferase
VAVVDWLWLATAILLSLALRIPFFRIPMLADEGGYAWATRGWVEGTGHLYDDLWISRPQGIFFVYAGIFDLFGTDTIAIRFAAWIAIALTIIAVWGFTRLCASSTAANLAGLIFAVTSSLPNLEGYSANAEVFMGLPAAVAALWLLGLRRSGWSRWQLVGVGLLIGIATSLKPSGAVMLPVAIALILLIGDGSSNRERWRRIYPILIGVAIIGIGSLIHGWMLGWSDFVYATITYRLTAQSAATVGLEHNLRAIGHLVNHSLELLLLVGLIFVVHHRQQLASLAAEIRTAISKGTSTPRSIAGRIIPVSTPGLFRNLRRPRNDGRFLLHLWLIGSLCGAAIGGDWWSHYLIQVVAPLSIWLAWTITLIWPGMARMARGALSTAIVILLLYPFWVLAYGSPEDMARAMFSHPGYPAQEEVARYIRENTEPGTTIYVAFDQASIYYLADRPPAFRHLYDQELHGIPSSYSDIIAIIRGPDRPQFIVSTLHPGPFADDSRAFWQEVGQYYEVVATIEGVPIYQDKETIDP